MPHSLQKLAEDALSACAELRSFTAGKSYDGVTGDRGLQTYHVELWHEVSEERANGVDHQRLVRLVDFVKGIMLPIN